MAQLEGVRDRAWGLLLRPSPQLRVDFGARAASASAVFSVFDSLQLERAMALVTELMSAADSAPDEDGLAAALDRYEQALATDDPDLVDYALMVFITHHPRGRALTHSIPPITLRNPELVVPSRSPGPVAVSFGPGLVVEGGALPDPDGLEWFREDPFANEHHTHWHVVYPFVGIPDATVPGGRRFKDRQGEIFLYMQQQMLARYDAERRALTLPRVVARDDYRSPIATGYDPGEHLADQGFAIRPVGAGLVDLRDQSGQVVYTVADHDRRRELLGRSVGGRSYLALVPPRPMDDVSLLGSTLEADGAGVHGPNDRDSAYGDLHNVGHGLIAGASVGGPGVMTSPAVAIRDPVFWEWHKHVDKFGAQWQQGAGIRPLDGAPPVRAHDTHLAFVDALPAAAADDLPGWARDALGGERWGEADPAPGVTTGTLETTMLGRTLTLADRVTAVPMQQLVHRPFVHLVRLENIADEQLPVTVRIFLAPTVDAGDRRAWIELDKFVHVLGPRERAVIARPGASSAVVRKPTVMAPELLKEAALALTAAEVAAMVADGLPAPIGAKLRPFTTRVATPDEVSTALGPADWRRALPFLRARATILPSEQPRRPSEDDAPEVIEELETANYCTCGWPYNLLLPRGTPDGMAFRLAVVCTDWSQDGVDGDEPCGSSAFCGARDRYPDRRPMGYPFDREFPDPVEVTLAAAAHVTVRDLVIRRTADRPADG